MMRTIVPWACSAAATRTCNAPTTRAVRQHCCRPSPRSSRVFCSAMTSNIALPTSCHLPSLQRSELQKCERNHVAITATGPDLGPFDFCRTFVQRLSNFCSTFVGRLSNFRPTIIGLSSYILQSYVLPYYNHAFYYPMPYGLSSYNLLSYVLPSCHPASYCHVVSSNVRSSTFIPCRCLVFFNPYVVLELCS
jgi:hypothetical protein